MKIETKVKIVSAGLILIGLYYFYKQRNQNAQIANEQDNSVQSNIVKPDYDKVLKKGSVGEEVKILQTALKTLVPDSNFGDKTEARLKRVMGVTETSINKYNQFIKK
jgi:hypothetical protein